MSKSCVMELRAIIPKEAQHSIMAIIGNQYKPRLSFSKWLEHRRYATIEKELKPMCKWVDFYDYLWSYSMFDFTNKSVLDIGSDIGSSAIFFLMNNANFVYLYDINKNYKATYNRLKKQAYRNEIFRNSDWLNKNKLLSTDADILKMDCEGCELQLLSDSLLRKYKEFSIALHKPPLDNYQFEKFKKLLEHHKGRYHGSVNNEEFVWLKILKK